MTGDGAPACGVANARDPGSAGRPPAPPWPPVAAPALQVGRVVGRISGPSGRPRRANGTHFSASAFGWQKRQLQPPEGRAYTRVTEFRREGRGLRGLGGDGRGPARAAGHIIALIVRCACTHGGPHAAAAAAGAQGQPRREQRGSAGTARACGRRRRCRRPARSCLLRAVPVAGCQRRGRRQRPTPAAGSMRAFRPPAPHAPRRRARRRARQCVRC